MMGGRDGVRLLARGGCWLGLVVLGAVACGADVDPEAARRGYRFLVEQPVLPPDFDQETFDAVWRVWPEPLRGKAAAASPERRRAMAFARYGLTERPGDDSGRPLQYVVDADGNWTMNCLSCHGGAVYGNPYPGAPNNTFALQTLTEEIRATKLRTAKPLTRMDLGSLVIPLGSTHGTTNAVNFGIALMNYRRPDLSLDRDRPRPPMVHHDMDAPPWWYFHKRPSIYIDGFAERGHRGLMQFALVPENGPEKFREWEEAFRDVEAYLKSLRPPEYPHRIDRELAERGRIAFEATCAECHGTYGPGGEYPSRRVPLESLGTDPVRLSALSVEGRQRYAASWFAEYGAQATVVDPDGYVAPPLDGIWASAPYLHNGSVPTLWHLLNPAERPRIWRRAAEELDAERVGLVVEEVDRVPLEEPDVAVRRQYFNTTRRGKSAAGHEYPEALDEAEKRAVLEYLKTL